MTKQISANKMFGGTQYVFSHKSAANNCDMRVAVYMPPQVKTEKCPALIWLSGLTCTDENFVTKAGAQRMAAELGLIIVAPDTSPRGDAVPDDDAYDFGKGAWVLSQCHAKTLGEEFSNGNLYPRRAHRMDERRPCLRPRAYRH